MTPEATDAASLIERERELAALRQAIEQAAAGRGGLVVVEGPAGSGRSRLLAAARTSCAEAHLLQLSTTASELERELTFGIALRLFEPLWADAAASIGPSAFTGSDTLIAALLRDHEIEPGGDADRQGALIHGLFLAIRQLIEMMPGERSDGVALIVDDAQWADGPSLRFLAYLAERAAELPIAVILGFRSGCKAADPRIPAAIRRISGVRVLHPRPLSDEGVATFVHRSWEDAAPGFVAACGRATAGVPGRLAELVSACSRLELDPTAANAFRVADVVPDETVDVVRGQLEAMPERARRVAEAAAVLGAGTGLREIGSLSGMEPEQVLSCAEGLIEAGILASSTPLSFTAPVLRSATLASLGEARGAQIHLRAARVLTEEAADPSRIASLLLKSPAGGLQEAIAPLREAARRALDAGAPARAVTLLERALAENPAPQRRAEILAELGAAEARAGAPDAATRFAEARRIATDPSLRARLALPQSELLYAAERHREAASELAAAVRELGDADPQLGLELTAAYIANGCLVPELHRHALAMRKRLLGTLDGDLSLHQQAALAHTLVLDGLLGAPRTRVRELAELFWADGTLHLTPGLELGGVLMCLGLVATDELELAIEITGELLGRVPPQSHARSEQALTCVQAWARYHQGDINQAEVDANLALLIDPDLQTSYAALAVAVIACCEIQRGHLERAATELARLEPLDQLNPLVRVLALDIRGQLRLAELAPEAALEDATEAGRLLEARFPGAGPGLIPWRSRAALANLALGRPAQAGELVEAELAAAQRIGLTASIIRNLRISGLALGSRGIARLADAAALCDSQPARLEHARALIDYGAALRRRNRRADAREPLRRGLDLSHRGGAARLEARALTELTAAGGRPRRSAASGLDSLTVSQRRVAELAARGLTTRQIAEALFVSPKTIEFHLRQTYMKLGVSSREGLADVVLAA